MTPRRYESRVALEVRAIAERSIMVAPLGWKTGALAPLFQVSRRPLIGLGPLEVGEVLTALADLPADTPDELGLRHWERSGE